MTRAAAFADLSSALSTPRNGALPGGERPAPRLPSCRLSSRPVALAIGPSLASPIGALKGRKGNTFSSGGSKRLFSDQQQGGRSRRGATRGGAGAPRAMFTGIVEEMGTVEELRQVDGGWELTVRAAVVLQDAKLGDSIAINGTCLTVSRINGSSFAVGLSPETLRRTSLGEVGAGSRVNLERSLLPTSRMGGHFVQGHVDGTGTIEGFRPEGDSLWVTIRADPSLLKYVVPKGYIAVDGTSLTVVDVSDADSTFTFMLVAYTQEHIVVPSKRPGDKVNLEVDIMGKYVERLLESRSQTLTPAAV